MKIDVLSSDLIEDLEIESINIIELDTDITQIEEWDSLNTLVLINYVKVNFDVDLTVEDIGESFKLSDLITHIEKNSKHKIN
jgi:acyl carrier protein